MRQKSANRRFWLLVVCLLAALLLLNLPQPASALGDLLKTTPTPTALFGEAAQTATGVDILEGVEGFGATLFGVAPVMLLAAILGSMAPGSPWCPVTMGR